MNPLIGFLIIILGIPICIAGLIALFSAIMLLLPDPIAQARANLELHPWRSIFIGLLNFAIGVIVISVLLTLASANYELQPVLIGVSMLIMAALAVPNLIGLCAAIILISIRLGETRKPLFTYLRGGGLLLFACLTPFVGWFVFTPLLIWASIGSVVMTLGQLKSKPPNDLIPETSASSTRSA